MNTFQQMYSGEWDNTSNCVFSREQVSRMYDDGIIGKVEAEELLRLRYRERRGDWEPDFREAADFIDMPLIRSLMERYPRSSK